MRYIETALDIDVNDFPANSQIIVDPINSTEHPIRAMQRANSEVKRALEWPAAAGAKRSKQESSLTSASTVAYSPAPSETKPAEGGAAKSSSKGAAGGSPTLPAIPKRTTISQEETADARIERLRAEDEALLNLAPVKLEGDQQAIPPPSPVLPACVSGIRYAKDAIMQVLKDKLMSNDEANHKFGPFEAPDNFWVFGKIVGI